MANDSGSLINASGTQLPYSAGLFIKASDSDVLRLLGGQSRHNYFGDGANGGVPFDAAGGVALGEPAGPGVGVGLASSSSTSKIRAALGPISGLTERSP